MGVNEIRDAISPIVERSGCEIVDIEERSEYGKRSATSNAITARKWKSGCTLP